MTDAISHIVFDWNGTLIDDIAVAVQGVNNVRSLQDLPAIDAVAYRKHFGFPIRGFYERLGIDFERLTFARLADTYLATFNEGIKLCALHEGARDVLDWARRNRLTVSVLSASQQETLLANLAHAGLIDRFDHIFGLDGSEAEGKIDLAHRLDATLGHPGHGALMIGDTDHDVEVAHACGWRAASVAHGHQTRDRLSSLHPDVFPDLPSVFEHHFSALRRNEEVR